MKVEEECDRLSFLSMAPATKAPPSSTGSFCPVILTFLPTSGRVHWTHTDFCDHVSKEYIAEVIEWLLRLHKNVMCLNPSMFLFLEANHELYEVEACLGHVTAVTSSPEVQVDSKHQPLAMPMCMAPGDSCPSHCFIKLSNFQALPAGAKTSPSRDRPPHYAFLCS